jgi:hypothetical protein
MGTTDWINRRQRRKETRKIDPVTSNGTMTAISEEIEATYRYAVDEGYNLALDSRISVEVSPLTIQSRIRTEIRPAQYRL